MEEQGDGQTGQKNMSHIECSSKFLMVNHYQMNNANIFFLVITILNICTLYVPKDILGQRIEEETGLLSNRQIMKTLYLHMFYKRKKNVLFPYLFIPKCVCVEFWFVFESCFR